MHNELQKKIKKNEKLLFPRDANAEVKFSDEKENASDTFLLGLPCYPGSSLYLPYRRKWFKEQPLTTRICTFIQFFKYD
jgi:hypothetical protein